MDNNNRMEYEKNHNSTFDIIKRTICNVSAKTKYCISMLCGIAIGYLAKSVYDHYKI